MKSLKNSLLEGRILFFVMTLLLGLNSAFADSNTFSCNQILIKSSESTASSNVVLFTGSSSSDRIVRQALEEKNEIERHLIAEPQSALVSLSQARMSRLSQGGGNYRAPLDELIKERVFDQLDILYLFGALILKNRLGDRYSRIDALRDLHDSFYMILEAMIFVRDNYQLNVYEKAQSKMLKLYLLISHDEIKRIANLEGYTIAEPDDQSRHHLQIILPDQIAQRSENIDLGELISSSGFASIHAEVQAQILTYLQETFRNYENSLLDTYTEETSRAALRYHMLLEKARAIAEFSMKAYSVDSVDKLPIGEILHLQRLISGLVKMRSLPLMEYALQVPAKDRVAAFLLNFTFSESRPQGANLKKFWMERVLTYKKSLEKELKHLRGIIEELNRIVPEESRIPQPEYLQN